ncbi:hypothetical protein CPC08DRAFT_760305 [Agrocybe pediades]|nr:hypothetical protein CPC08DRAFT_760305 [Agrocybe pediades]
MSNRNSVGLVFGDFCLIASTYVTTSHLLVHCREQSRASKKGSYLCKLPRCAVSPHIPIPLKDVSTHLRSHLSRSQLECPVNGCGLTFNRHQGLEDHFEDLHGEFLNRSISLPSPLLLPTWKPVQIPHSTEDPPSIPPIMSTPGCVLLQPVRGTWRKRPSTPKQSFVDLSSSQQSPARRGIKMDKDDEAKAVKLRQKEEPSNGIMFDDLPRSHDWKDFEVEEINIGAEGAVRKRGPCYDLSRPSPFLDPSVYGVRQLPLTTTYEAFLLENPWVEEDTSKSEKEKKAVAAQAGPSLDAGSGGSQPSVRPPTPSSTFTSNNLSGTVTLS